MEYQTGKKYDTQNGFKADIRYLHNGHLCGHVITDCTPAGFCMMHWTLDGFVFGADPGFDLIYPGCGGDHDWEDCGTEMQCTYQHCNETKPIKTGDPAQPNKEGKG